MVYHVNNGHLADAADRNHKGVLNNVDRGAISVWDGERSQKVRDKPTSANVRR